MRALVPFVITAAIAEKKLINLDGCDFAGIAADVVVIEELLAFGTRSVPVAEKEERTFIKSR